MRRQRLHLLRRARPLRRLRRATGSHLQRYYPKPKVTRGYSGQSKAPDGEYRKADGYGPAQNVPKPRNEPAQYPETEGLNRMMMEVGSMPITTQFRLVTAPMPSSM